MTAFDADVAGDETAAEDEDVFLSEDEDSSPADVGDDDAAEDEAEAEAEAEVEAEAEAVVVPADIADLTHVVLRPLVGAGAERFIGEVVDASGWRMADLLVEDRRLRVFGRDDPTPVTDGEGRYFIDDDALLAYIDVSASNAASNSKEF